MLDWFENVGRKIKTFARAWFWIETLAGIILGITMIVIGSSGMNEGLIATGVIMCIAAMFVAWLNTIITYAFGDLVENVDRLAQHFCGEREYENSSEKIQNTIVEIEENRPKYRCTNCGCDVCFGDYECKNCGQKFDWNKL